MPFMPRKKKTTKSMGKPRRARQFGRPSRAVSRYSGVRTFTETLDGGVIFTSGSGSGGIFSAAIASIPQWENYAALYQQYCIKKLQVVLVPKFTGVDLNTFSQNVGVGGLLGYSSPKITYAIEDSPALTAPASQLEVLQMNGSRVHNLASSRNLTIKCRPTPNIMIGNQTNGGMAEYRVRKTQWFSFPSADYPGGAALDPNNVYHFGIPYWAEAISAPTTSTLGIAQVILKVTFAVRDPK